MKPAPTVSANVAIVLALAGCGDVVVLGSEGGLALQYRCGAEEAKAATAAELSLVRRSAGRAIRYEAERAGGERVAGIEAAFRAGDESALEAALVEYVCAHGDIAVRAARFPEPGSEPPALQLAVLDGAGATLSLEDLLGSVVVVNFWATWCGPCREEYPELVALQREFADSGVVVLGILKDDTPEAARSWMAEHDGGVLTLLDPSGDGARAYGVRALPQTFVIGRDGTMVRRGLGYRAGGPSEMVRAALTVDG